MRSSRPEVFCRKGVLRKFAKLQNTFGGCFYSHQHTVQYQRRKNDTFHSFCLKQYHRMVNAPSVSKYTKQSLENTSSSTAAAVIHSCFGSQNLMEVLANHFCFRDEHFIFDLRERNVLKLSRKASRTLQRKLFIFHCFLKSPFIPHTIIIDSTICPNISELTLIAIILDQIYRTK